MSLEPAGMTYVFLSARELWYALQGKYMLEKLCSDISSMLVNQQYVLSKVPLKRKHTKKVMYWSIDEMLWSEPHRNLTLYFPWELDYEFWTCWDDHNYFLEQFSLPTLEIN